MSAAQHADDERWDCCDRPVTEHGRGGHCPTLRTADTIPAMKLIRWMVKCPWCDWTSGELSESGFARDSLRSHLGTHFDADVCS